MRNTKISRIIIRDLSYDNWDDNLGLCQMSEQCNFTETNTVYKIQLPSNKAEYCELTLSTHLIKRLTFEFTMVIQLAG